ncbi:hypothetical protein [uncultured Campylobacter sp.]|uniref:hypothetical protein n=1 Tax=uncultured Campylobacter sp. TaxID=218934 RepID=UPI00262DC769|nr:hypothetical protein [uncultured Campylobacter sp.]
MDLFIALSFILVTFFIALIKPKKIKNKFIWLFIWFLFCFGDMLITSRINHYYAKKYAGITIYDKSRDSCLYIGSGHIFKHRDKYNSLYESIEHSYINLIYDHTLKFIDFKEKSSKTNTNDKIFRIYLDKNSSNNCIDSPEIFKKRYLCGEKIPCDKIYPLYIKYHSDPTTYKVINYASYDTLQNVPKTQKDVIKQIIELVKVYYPKKDEYYEQCDWDDYVVARIIENFQNFSEKMKDKQKLYDNKCLAISQIKEFCGLEYYENLQDIDVKIGYFGSLIGVKAYYFGMIKDRNSGKIVADGVVIKSHYAGWILEKFIKYFGEESRNDNGICNPNKKSEHISKCSDNLIKQYFKGKDL